MGELVSENWLWKQTTSGFPFTSHPPPMRESEVHPQIISSVYSMWYIDFSTRKEWSLFCDGRKKTHTLSIFSYLKSDVGSKKFKGFCLPAPPPLQWESEIYPQMMTSVHSIWYLDFGTQKERTLFSWAQIKTQPLSIFWYLKSDFESLKL